MFDDVNHTQLKVEAKNAISLVIRYIAWFKKDDVAASICIAHM